MLIIREKLAELYESEQQWSKAAQMLSGIDLDSGMRYNNHFPFNHSCESRIIQIVDFVSLVTMSSCGLCQSDRRVIPVVKMCSNCSFIPRGTIHFCNCSLNLTMVVITMSCMGVL